MTTLPDGATIHIAYGAATGLLLERTTDPLGNISEKTSDVRGNTLSVTRKDPSGTTLTKASYQYDALGQMEKALDAREAPVVVKYDLLGRKTSLSSADSGTVRYTYDESGNIERKTDNVLRSRGEAIEYTYDGLNRLVKIDYPRSEDVTYEYGGSGAAGVNGAGRVLKRTDQSGSVRYTYGKLGETARVSRTIKRLARMGGSEEAEFEYEWDYLGRTQRIRYPDGEEVRYGYDSGGQIQSARGRYRGLETEYVKDIAYDAFGQRTYIEYGNGVRTEYAYDENRRWLESIHTQSAASRTYQEMEYRFDAVGNVLGYKNQARNYETSQDYGYDSLYQLVSAEGTTKYNPYGPGEYTSEYKQTFAFDEVGNLRKKTSVCDGSPPQSPWKDLTYSQEYTYYEGKNHQAEIIGDIYYEYDGNGNVTEARKGGHGNAISSGEVYTEGNTHYTDSGFGLEEGREKKPAWARYYTWDDGARGSAHENPYLSANGAKRRTRRTGLRRARREA